MVLFSLNQANSLIVCYIYFRLLVGAPKAQTNQKRVERGGAVYLCHPRTSNCTQLPFDTKGNYKDVVEKTKSVFSGAKTVIY